MIKHTQSFKRLKTEQQKILDFTVLVCYAIPNLKKSIKGFKTSVPNYETLAKADYFIEDVNIPKIEKLAQNYKGDLGKYTLISAFSFFESYIKDVVKELIEFHGGADTFIQTISQRHAALIANQSEEIKKSKKKLQEPIKKKNHQQYQKYIDLLNKESQYRNPSEYLATYGLKTFIDTVSGSNFRSVLIPDLLEFAFNIDLTEKINRHEHLKEKNLRETFDAMRNIRNNIGHGSESDIGFEKVMDLIRYIRYLSVKVDEHLTKHYFVLERSK